MLEALIIILLVVIIAGFGGLFFILFKKKPEPEKKDDSGMLMLQQQIGKISDVLDFKLSESNKSFQHQFSQSADLIRNITERLTRLDETNKQVVGVGDQLKGLQDILKNPKQRGVLGEYYLETVLKNVLPPGSFETQYSFKDGSIVDAVIFVDKRIIPIDSKFSLENYNRMIESEGESERKRFEMSFINDLKMRIEETSKYVRPEEKTMDFAFMFIPSEAVYYDLLINKVGALKEDTNNLIHYAWKKRVVVVGANSFVAFLQTILQGLKNQKISEEAQAIIKGVDRLGKHLSSYSEYLRRLGQHLDNTVGSYNKAKKEFEKMDKDVVRLTDGKSRIEIDEIEHPMLDE